MTDKPDYYEVLGVAKTATDDEIKRAHKAIVMKNHPDRVKLTNPTKEVLDAAAAKLMLANDALKVLSDPTSRAAYDKYGHKGVENLTAGKSAASGQTFAEVAGPTLKRTYSTEDTFDFFEKRKAAEDRSSGSTGPATDREAARLARLARRNKGGDGPSSSDTSTPDTPDAPPPSSTFRDVADKVSTASDALRGGATLPVDVLVKFRENLADFIGEVDKAIARAKNPGGPSR